MQPWPGQIWDWRRCGASNAARERLLKSNCRVFSLTGERFDAGYPTPVES